MIEIKVKVHCDVCKASVECWADINRPQQIPPDDAADWRFLDCNHYCPDCKAQVDEGTDADA